jgi:hypothetical protein
MQETVAEIATPEQAKPGTVLEGKTEAVRLAMEALGEEIARHLAERLEQTSKPLEEEISALQAKAAALRESYAALQPRVASKLRLLAFAIDESVASARDDEAAQKRDEAAELQTNLRNVEDEAQRCDLRVIQLERKRSSDVEIAFKKAYGDARRATVATSTATAGLLDRTWDSLCQFDVGSNRITVGVAGIRHRINLTPDDRGPEKAAFFSLIRWFGFGGRTR